MTRRRGPSADQLAPDGRRAGFEIDVLAGEAEDLAPTQSVECQRERRLIPVAGEGGQDAAGMSGESARTRLEVASVGYLAGRAST